MSELKNCPFCGKSGFVDTIFHEQRKSYKWFATVMCRYCQATCGGTGFYETEEEAKAEAIQAWNRRENHEV